MGRKFRPFGFVCILLLVGTLAPTGFSQSSPASLAVHGPILIEGDADLCNLEDLDNGQDKADGIVNCETADGSAARPYIVTGWNVTWDPTGPCRLEPRPELCPPLPPCSTSSAPAAVAVCATRKHLRIENISVGNAEVVRNQAPAAAILLSNVDNVQLRHVTGQAGGIVLLIESGKPIPTLSARTGEVIVEDLRVRSWLERVESALGGLPGGLRLAELSLIRVIDTPVAFRRLVVDATMRDVALTANASNAAPAFSLTDSMFENGSATVGLELFDVDALIERNVFRNLGVAAAGGAAGDAIAVSGGNVVIRQNLFDLQGDGIQLSGAPTGSIRENFFNPPSPRRNDQVELRAVAQEVNGCTSIRVAYNDLPGASVANEDNTCPLDARYNWWDGNPRTVTASDGGGAINTQPALSRPIGELPVVLVAAPTNGTQVHGKILLSGTTRVPGALILDRIEASDSESEWTENVTAAAAPAWSLVWDMTGDPLGPTALFVRACAAGDDCGLPTRVDVLVIERPGAPIAVLEATPRVAKVGQAILLDASLSYSPQGRPLLSYRFDVGDGNLTSWQPSPLHEIRFDAPGNYPVSAHVLDAQGLLSENLPQLVIRIQPESDADGGGQIPGFASWMLLAVLVGLTIARRRHR